MSIAFNPLLLHRSTDIHPRSWVCLHGVAVGTYLRCLVGVVLKQKKLSKRALFILISKRLSCSLSTIEMVFHSPRNFYPIPLLLELLRLSNKKRIPETIIQNVKYVKVNSASAKQVRTVYLLDSTLSQILGAFMADGSLSVQVVFANSSPKPLDVLKKRLEALGVVTSCGKSDSRKQYYISVQLNKNNTRLINRYIKNSLLVQTHYTIELTDAYKDNVIAFNKWVYRVFETTPTGFGRKKNAWRTTFSNKILARYLMTFFAVTPGPKSYIAHEPIIIQRSKLSIRKAFAKGVLMFDGCVTKKSTIAFGTVSKNLFISIKEIWQEDGIKFGETIQQREKRLELNLYTLTKNSRRKVSSYFEQNTYKWKLSKGNFTDIAYKNTTFSDYTASFAGMMKIIRQVKNCDAIFLKHYFKCSHTTIRIYLKILKKQGRIKLSKHPRYISNYVHSHTTLLLNNKSHCLIFKKIEKNFGTYKNFADFLELQKSTLSAWKVRKNRIPIYMLRKICKVLDINFSEVSRNIVKTDREIIEII